ncbi:MAG: hypothetical protein ACLFMP_02610, partial [Desulfonatronovibrionaceae bacterium]
SKKQLLPLVLVLMFTLLFGCTASKDNGAQEEPDVPPPSEEEALNNYYDFDDIPVPKEMEIRSDDSILFQSPNLKAGAVVFEGRVEAISLFDFFLNNMPKENWNLRSYFKYGRYIMVFEKPNKDCIIRIIDHRFKTELQIWVTPRFSGEKDEILGPDTLPEEDLEQ